MIGPGTGIAPFMSMIRERNYLVDKLILEDPSLYHEEKYLDSNILFFGARFSKNEYYHKSELESLNEADRILLFTAFSRDVPSSKNYVQH